MEYLYVLWLVIYVDFVFEEVICVVVVYVIVVVFVVLFEWRVCFWCVFEVLSVYEFVFFVVLLELYFVG